MGRDREHKERILSLTNGGRVRVDLLVSSDELQGPAPYLWETLVRRASTDIPYIEE